MPAQATATQAERVPIDELAIVRFEGFPAPTAQALAGKLAARGISTRVDSVSQSRLSKNKVGQG